MIEKHIEQKEKEINKILKEVGDLDFKSYYLGKLAGLKEFEEIFVEKEVIENNKELLPTKFGKKILNMLDFWSIDIDEKSIENNIGSIWFKDQEGNRYSLTVIKTEQ